MGGGGERGVGKGGGGGERSLKKRAIKGHSNTSYPLTKNLNLHKNYVFERIS